MSATTIVQDLLKEMQAESAKTVSQKENAIGVVRSGDKIVLPTDMSYKDAHKWLICQEEAEESTVRVLSSIECFPLDGVIALSRAMREVYGFTDIRDKGFWGQDVAPTFVEVPTATGYESAPLGMIKPPKWEGGYLKAEINGAKILIAGEVKRKFEKETQDIIHKTKQLLLDKSIYRGHAVHMDLSWYNGSRPFDLMNDSPKFMKISDTKLILNAVLRFELESSIFMLIEHTKVCMEHGIAIKHGALLKGTFGTGKTLTAKVIAKKCQDNGWTFIYLKSADQLASGLRIAKMYAPACVFVEDIDTVVNERDDGMNELLNILDGVDTKDAPIITVLTTNKPEDIEPSFLRAGRIDSIIHFAEPDAETAMEFVRSFSGAYLKAGEDLKHTGELLSGLVPAFICEAVNKAKRYTIHRTGASDITGLMLANDLELAAQSVSDHYSHLKPKEFTPEQILAKQLEAVNTHGLKDTIKETIAESGFDEGLMDAIKDHVN